VSRSDGPGAWENAEADDRVIAGQRPDTTFSAPAAIRAAWGQPPTAQRPRTIALVAWRPVVKDALRGFAKVLQPSGLKLIDCPILVSTGKTWASLPSKPVLDSVEEVIQRHLPPDQFAILKTAEKSERELIAGLVGMIAGGGAP
jgi:hypothetical protein